MGYGVCNKEGVDDDEEEKRSPDVLEVKFNEEN
jgi:hypothetical protein